MIICNMVNFDINRAYISKKTARQKSVSQFMVLGD